jgi:hypothetical protein
MSSASDAYCELGDIERVTAPFTMFAWGEVEGRLWDPCDAGAIDRRAAGGTAPGGGCLLGSGYLMCSMGKIGKEVGCRDQVEDRLVSRT